MDENKDMQDCVDGVCKVLRSTKGQVRGKIGTVIGLITPLLLRSGDARIVALGLALQAVSTFLSRK